MTNICACIGCTNLSNQENNVSFHKFPLDDTDLLQKWLANVSRDNFTPTADHCVCSDHFLSNDYMTGIHPRDDHDGIHPQLLQQAVPTVFPSHPAHNQSAREHPKRSAPKRIRYTDESLLQAPVKRKKPDPPPKPEPPAKRNPSELKLNAAFDRVTRELRDTKRKLLVAQRELKSVRVRLEKRDCTVSRLLKVVKDHNMIGQGQLDRLHINIGKKTLALIENELKEHGQRVLEPII